MDTHNSKGIWNRWMPALIFVLVLSVAAVSGAASAKKKTDGGIKATDKDLAITLERSGCNGKCPIYALRLYGDGKVVYEGGENVAITGRQTVTIAPAKIKELLEQFRRSGFLAMKERYEEPVTGIPSMTLSVILNGKMKTVYRGSARASGQAAKRSPEDLKAINKLYALSEQIDSVTDSKRWIEGSASAQGTLLPQEPTPQAPAPKSAPPLPLPVPPSPGVRAAEGLITYNDTQHGFSLRHPKTWQRAGGGDMLYAAVGTYPQGGVISLVVRQGDLDGPLNEQRFEDTVTEILRGFVVTARRDYTTKLGDHKAYVSEAVYREGDRLWFTVVISIASRGQVFSLAGLTSPATNEALKESLRNAALSLRLSR